MIASKLLSKSNISLNFRFVKYFSATTQSQESRYIPRKVGRPDNEQINNDNFMKHLDSMLSVQELPDADMEMDNIMNILNNPNFSFKEFTGQVKQVHEMTDETREEIEQGQKIMKEKVDEAEKHIIFTDVFNKWALKLMDHTPATILNEMAVRVFVGSRDIPKDIPTALKLLSQAEKNKESLTTKEKYDIEYFKVMLKRMNSSKQKDTNSFWEMNEELKQLAEKGQPNAMYSYGSELLSL